MLLKSGAQTTGNEQMCLVRVVNVATSNEVSKSKQKYHDDVYNDRRRGAEKPKREDKISEAADCV